MPPEEKKASRDGRLKPVSLDALDKVGLPSKGETSLNNYQAQSDYFDLIRQRCERDAAGQPGAHGPGAVDATLAPSTASLSASATPTSNAGVSKRFNPAQSDRDRVLLGLRKLREAIIATKRADQFAQTVFMYAIRIGIEINSMETYHGALLYLVRAPRLAKSTPALELREFQVYYILDVAGRQKDLQRACGALSALKLWRSTAGEAVQSFLSQNWIRFWRVVDKASSLERTLLDHLADRVREHATACLQRAYFTVDRPYLEKSLHREATLVMAQVNWQLEENTVVIRRPKGR